MEMDTTEFSEEKRGEKKSETGSDENNKGQENEKRLARRDDPQKKKVRLNEPEAKFQKDHHLPSRHQPETPYYQSPKDRKINQLHSFFMEQNGSNFQSRDLLNDQQHSSIAKKRTWRELLLEDNSAFESNPDEIIQNDGMSVDHSPPLLPLPKEIDILSDSLPRAMKALEELSRGDYLSISLEQKVRDILKTKPRRKDPYITQNNHRNNDRHNHGSENNEEEEGDEDDTTDQYKWTVAALELCAEDKAYADCAESLGILFGYVWE